MSKQVPEMKLHLHVRRLLADLQMKASKKTAWFNILRRSLRLSGSLGRGLLQPGKKEQTLSSTEILSCMNNLGLFAQVKVLKYS